MPRTRFFLEMAHEIVVERRLAPLGNFLRFLLTTFVSKVALQSLTEDIQALVIKHVADILNALPEASANDRTVLRTQSVESSIHLLSVNRHRRYMLVWELTQVTQCFTELKLVPKPWTSCVTLVRACKEVGSIYPRQVETIVSLMFTAGGNFSVEASLKLNACPPESTRPGIESRSTAGKQGSCRRGAKSYQGSQ